MANVIDELKAKVEARRSRIASIQEEIAGLQITIGILEAEERTPVQYELMPTRPGRPLGPSREATTIVNKIEAILRSHGGMAHRREILRELEADGVHFTGKKEGNRLQKLSGHLSNYRDRWEPVTRPGDGRWRLKERPQN